ncbi:MAG: hypothetical protein U0441_20170 [Polyangiaceae bacterium]
MSSRARGLVAIVSFTFFAWACERGAADFDSCPSGLLRTILDGSSPVCACEADTNGDKVITDEEQANRAMAVAGDLVFVSCNSDDWVPEGYFFAPGDGRIIQVPEICKVSGQPNVYVTHESIECTACDCGQSCVPEACLERCNVADTGCDDGSYCAASGECLACAAAGTGTGARECGGECGGCPDDSMCVDGVCTGLVRCLVKPDGVCSEKAPTWCPYSLLALGATGAWVSGYSCSCTLQFTCNEGCNGTYQTTYPGTIE